MRGVAAIALVAMAALWGWTFVIVKEIVADTPPLTFLALRFALAVVLLAALSYRRLRGMTRGELLAGAWIGVALFLGYALQTWGLQFPGAAKSGLITGLYVVLVPVLGGLAWRRRERPHLWIGVGLATIGMTLLAWGGGGLHGRVNLGDLLTLGCAVSFAVHILLVDHHVRRTDYLRLLFVQIATVALLSLLGALAFERAPIVFSSELVRGVAITGVAATAVALYVMNRFQALSTATLTAILLATEPMFAALFGVLLLGERLAAAQWIGGALIVLGILVPQIRRLQGEDHRDPADGDCGADDRPGADRDPELESFQEQEDHRRKREKRRSGPHRGCAQRDQ